MAELLFNTREVKELQRQCLHHNIFPIDLANGFDGKPKPVVRALKGIVDSCVEQLDEMPFTEVQAVVNGLPSGLRHMLEPLEEPLLTEDLSRIAQYCIAAQIQKGYSSVADVIALSVDNSHVLAECPELRDLFDDDGLLKLDHRFYLMDGGIKYGKFVLHYHQFLRRGFSSNPNFNFLGTFAHYRSRTKAQNTFRIAIDHRRLMRFDDYHQMMELDTWYGPGFDPDELDDLTKTGLTVVVRSHPSPFDSNYSLVKTEFLWKANETDGVKTLEIEEVASESTPVDNWHVNRYVHAERDTVRRTFRHFDAAAKVYPHSTYKQRVDETMPNQIKPAHYIKLFRIDGNINLDDWLSLLSMFYKGNEMVVEYFDPQLFREKFLPIISRWQDAMTN
ncbi:MAG: hypothetical protein KJ000_16280 [Pirellulaceae bacterium]|nr:hypothetical protein [Pirellulaceae bacterium]